MASFIARLFGGGKGSSSPAPQPAPVAPPAPAPAPAPVVQPKAKTVSKYAGAVARKLEGEEAKIAKKMLLGE